jgi:hypothetical protein
MSKDFSQLGNPGDDSLREYVVIVESYDQLESLYNDLETDGGSDTIPERACECSKRKPGFRSTRYKLTYEEAENILKDDRVISVELTAEERGLKKIPYAWTTTSSNFDKATASDPNDINWGFIRSLSLQQNAGLPSWGTGSTSITETIYSDLSGKNVDVVIADDGTPYPSTLEYQQNPDGTGYTRLVQYNWFQHKSELGLGANGVYDYSLSATTNEPRLQEHGAHTMGTVGGNTQGWARDANLYFISVYDSNFEDYVLAFHNNKPVNPVTGVKNPTVMNNSWGYNATTFSTNNVSKIFYRGTEYFPTSGSLGSYVWDTTVLNNFWCTKSLTRVAEVDQDFVDLQNAGIIVIGSAGNDNSYADVPGGLDYDNYFVMSGSTYYPHRGSSPSAAPGVICVGAAGSHNESPSGSSVYTASSVETGDYRAEFSNFGPRIDVWAAGAAVQSIWRSGQALYDSVSATDPRLTALSLTDTINNNFKKCPGTSMSGPQVCGIFACLAEAYPRMKQSDARNYIETFCSSTMQWTLGGRLDLSDIGVSKNPDSGTKYAFLKGPRISDGLSGSMHKVVYPNSMSPSKPSTGFMYPRTSKFYGLSSATYALSVNTPTVDSTGTNSATVTLTTTGIPDGTKVPYIITSKYKGTGVTIPGADYGIYRASDSTNTYSIIKSGSQFGDGDGTGEVGTEKRHRINMSVASTNPTWVDDPAGWSYYGYESQIETPPPNGTLNISVTASGTSAYLMSGTDRVGTVSSSNNPTITVNYGDTINFNVTAAGHPFYIKYSTTAGGTNDQVTGGITNNGSQSGTVSLNTASLNKADGTPLSNDGEFAGITIYYQCSAHSSMRGIIDVRMRGYPTYYPTTIQTGMFTGTADDGYWKFPIPWNVPIFGVNRNEIFVSTNSYLSFGSGSTAYQNLATLPIDKLMLSSIDGRCSGILYGIYGTSPNRFMIIDYYGNTSASGNGNTTYWQAWLYENDPNNIFVSVIANGNITDTFDRYPFYQDKILGNINTTGVFTVNNDAANLVITPSASFVAPPEGSMNVNLRLGFHNSPSVDFSVT